MVRRCGAPRHDESLQRGGLEEVVRGDRGDAVLVELENGEVGRVERWHLLQVVVVQAQLLETWVAKSGEIGACGGGALEHPRRWQGAGGPASGPLPEGSLTIFHAARLVRGISEPSRTSRLSLMLRTERKGLGLGFGLLPNL